MNPTELLEKAKELLANGDINAAKDFITKHKDDLGGYFDKAKDLLNGLDLSQGLDGVLDKAKDLGVDVDGGLDQIKGLFGK